MSLPESQPPAGSDTGQAIRRLDITDLERIQRFRRAGYGGSVSDALHSLGVDTTVFSDRFKPLRQGMQLVGRALPIKLHSLVEPRTPAHQAALEARWAAEGGHPQKRMMQAVADAEDGTVLCFDCGGDLQPAHFGEMSCQVAYAHGCRGMLLAGNCRDTQYILKMPDFPIFSFGTRPNAFGGWIITEVNTPIYLPGHLTHYVRVNPGDFIFGDNDGVQLIPAAVVDEVLLRVEATFEFENRERELLAAGMPVDEVYRTFGVL
ncbi:MAG TPA: RraA family protein [Chthonomonadaceae bacterium]|nr:RraA family protein [Chthonomonadaceae bacterium]